MMFSLFSGWVTCSVSVWIREQIGLDSVAGNHHDRKRKRLVLEGVAITVTVIVMCFIDSFIEKAPREDYALLRQHIYWGLYYRSEANYYDKRSLRSTNFTNLFIFYEGTEGYTTQFM